MPARVIFTQKQMLRTKIKLIPATTCENEGIRSRFETRQNTGGQPRETTGDRGEVYVENVRLSYRQGGGDKGLPREVYKWQPRERRVSSSMSIVAGA